MNKIEEKLLKLNKDKLKPSPSPETQKGAINLITKKKSTNITEQMEQNNINKTDKTDKDDKTDTKTLEKIDEKPNIKPTEKPAKMRNSFLDKLNKVNEQKTEKNKTELLKNPGAINSQNKESNNSPTGTKGSTESCSSEVTNAILNRLHIFNKTQPLSINKQDEKITDILVKDSNEGKVIQQESKAVSPSIIHTNQTNNINQVNIFNHTANPNSKNTRKYRKSSSINEIDPKLKDKLYSINNPSTSNVNKNNLSSSVPKNLNKKVSDSSVTKLHKISINEEKIEIINTQDKHNHEIKHGNIKDKQQDKHQEKQPQKATEPIVKSGGVKDFLSKLNQNLSNQSPVNPIKANPVNMNVIKNSFPIQNNLFKENKDIVNNAPLIQLNPMNVDIPNVSETNANPLKKKPSNVSNTDSNVSIQEKKDSITNLSSPVKNMIAQLQNNKPKLISPVTKTDKPKYDEIIKKDEESKEESKKNWFLSKLNAQLNKKKSITQPLESSHKEGKKSIIIMDLAEKLEKNLGNIIAESVDEEDGCKENEGKEINEKKDIKENIMKSPITLLLQEKLKDRLTNMGNNVNKDNKYSITKKLSDKKMDKLELDRKTNNEITDILLEKPAMKKGTKIKKGAKPVF